jgi:hypothetical protein
LEFSFQSRSAFNAFWLTSNSEASWSIYEIRHLNNFALFIRGFKRLGSTCFSIQQPPLARWATIIAKGAGAENETLSEKAEQAGRESFGGG